MMKYFSKYKNSLFFRLFTYQLLGVLAGSFCVLITYHFSVVALSKNNFDNEVKILRSELEIHQDQWRAWAFLGMEDTLEKNLETFKREKGLLSLNVGKLNEVKTGDHDIVLPSVSAASANLDEYYLMASLIRPSVMSTFKNNSAVFGFLLLGSMVFLFISYLSLKYLRNKIYSPIKYLILELENLESGKDFIPEKINAEAEMRTFVDAFARLQGKLRQSERAAAFGALATQVAHDIRSPIEVLKSLNVDFLPLPADSRQRLQLSVNRMEEIAFHLLKSYKNDSGKSDAAVRPEELLSLMESILQEKKFEHSGKKISISGDFTKDSYGLFSNVRRSDLKRVISNLINNGVDAINEDQGKVEVRLFSNRNENIIEVSDNGSGIPESIKGKIFQKGFTTKDNGNGLGVAGAMDIISSFGGRIKFESCEGAGTTFKVFLPSSRTPDEFVKSVKAYRYDRIIILDDDLNFHDIWKAKLAGVLAKVEFYQTARELFFVHNSLPPKTLFLTDFDLMEAGIDGIDCMLKYNLKNDSILITARSEETSLQERCIKHGIKMVSKSVISFLQIEDRPAEIVLTDDDNLTGMHSSINSKSKEISF